MMKMNQTILMTALAMCWATWAHAVSLGPLVIESAPGEPIQGVIEVRDIDVLSKNPQPAIIRVAPPATYDRNGMAWPKELQGLRLESDQEKSSVFVRVIGENRLRDSSFPLLLELNVGGQVTLRQYNVRVQDGRVIASQASSLTQEDRALAPETSESSSALHTKEVRKIVIEPRTEVQKVQQLQKRLDRKGRYAPNVVHDYVALNGFDSTKGFSVTHDMTIWSIAKLYWPAYRGTTIEQLIVAFRRRNPKAFLQNDRLHLGAGTHLEPPTAQRVFAKDPEKAFRAVHGSEEAMPMVTKNLIDAQKMSYEAAELVARAQMAKKLAGATSLRIARAGRFALEAYREQVIEEKRLLGEENPGAVMQNPRYDSLRKADDVVAPQVARSVKSTTQEETAPIESRAQNRVKDVSQSQVQEAQSVAPQSQEKRPAKAPALSSETRANDREPWWYYAVAFLFVLLGWLGLRRKKDEEPTPDPEKKQGTVTLQKDVPRTTQAQKRALEATVSEAIKNGTTAGAMGVGAQAFTDAKIAQAKVRAQKERNASQNETQKIVRTGSAWHEMTPTDSAKLRDVKANAPWDDQKVREESRPMPPTEKTAPLAATIPVKVKVKFVQPEVPAKAPVAPSPAVTPVATTPRTPEPLSVKDIVGDLSLDLEEQPKSTTMTKPQGKKPASKEQAQFEAIEGKLKLAGSFIGLGALKEAQELLKVVKEQGNKDQRERAQFLEERIQKGS